MPRLFPDYYETLELAELDEETKDELYDIEYERFREIEDEYKRSLEE